MCSDIMGRFYHTAESDSCFVHHTAESDSCCVHHTAESDSCFVHQTAKSDSAVCQPAHLGVRFENCTGLRLILKGH